MEQSLKQSEVAVLYSGGYESEYCARKYPTLDKLFIQCLDTPYWMMMEMEKRGCVIYRTMLPHRYVILQGILAAKELGYTGLIIGNEKDVLTGDIWSPYSDIIEGMEFSAYYWNQVKRVFNIQLENPIHGMTHAEVIKAVGVDKENIFTCDFGWKEGKKRCGECENCKEEERVYQLYYSDSRA